MSDHNDNAFDLLSPAAPRRNNYFAGKLMNAREFTMEQNYFNEKRWLLNRLGLGSGVLDGLDLTVDFGGYLALSPGVAIDRLGREIIVPDPVRIDCHRITDVCGDVQKWIAAGKVTVALAYLDRPADMVPVLTAGTETDDGFQPNAIVESYRALVLEAAAAEDTDKPEPDAALMDPCADWGHPNIRPTSAEAYVVLGQVTLPTPGEPLTEDNISYATCPVVVSNKRLLEMVCYLWDRVEDLQNRAGS